MGNESTKFSHRHYCCGHFEFLDWSIYWTQWSGTNGRWIRWFQQWVRRLMEPEMIANMYFVQRPKLHFSIIFFFCFYSGDPGAELEFWLSFQRRSESKLFQRFCNFLSERYVFWCSLVVNASKCMQLDANLVMRVYHFSDWYPSWSQHLWRSKRSSQIDSEGNTFVAGNFDGCVRGVCGCCRWLCRTWCNG